ncbi:MAG: ferrochelatase [Myxococcota bacterium]|jgi:ferrochelatase|nr:ferrochelatase [Myxococcota bacterium]
MTAPRRGVLLVNLGSPDAPTPRAVRRYLREFLGDPRVLDMPALGRWLLLNLVILPTRPRRSAEAYEKVWTPEGSPLLVYGRALRDALRKELGDDWCVELAMRYGVPSIDAALERLAAADVDRIVVVPLFPHYASASTGSALDAVYAAAAERNNVPPLAVVPSFYAEPGFVRALTAVARELPEERRPDHLLISFHGLPERQVKASDTTGKHCLASETCCDAIGPANRFCYRAQCHATARALAESLGLRREHWTLSFQSRLGRTPWIKPYTDEVLPELFERGIRRLAVACPSFVADCLETIEEIGIRAREQWLELGGEDLVLVPCVNDHPLWVEALATWIRAQGAR